MGRGCQAKSYGVPFVPNELSKPGDLGYFLHWKKVSFFLVGEEFPKQKSGSYPISAGFRPVGGCLSMLSKKP